jgi:hypothetical protein
MVRRLTAFLFAFLLLFTPFAHSINVDATDISNHQYYDAALTEINNAKESIYVAMYSMYTRANEPESTPYKLINALIDAHKRKVEVTVYLDQTSGNEKSNTVAYEMLNTAGVTVYLIDPKVKLHAKVIVIDNKVVIDGSSNWTQRALGDPSRPDLIENFESDYVLRSPELAKIKLGFFKALDEFKITGINKKPVATVRVSGRFLTDSRFCSGLITNSAGYALRMYLKLLRDNKIGWVDIDYVPWAQYLKLNAKQGERYRRTQLRGVVDDLKNKYHLVDYQVGAGFRLKVRLVDYDDASKDYAAPREDYFLVPVTFWEYGLDSELKETQVAAYFICINEQALQWPKSYWNLGFSAIAQKYHISVRPLIASFGVLEKMDLIEVWRTPAKPGESYADRDANRYRLRPLLSCKERAAMWQKMEKKYGKEKVRLAREFAQVIDKENNFDSVTDTIGLIDKYGEPTVRKAIGYMVDLSHNNSARDTVYLKAIVERLAAGAP